jgi:integrase
VIRLKRFDLSDSFVGDISHLAVPPLNISRGFRQVVEDRELRGVGGKVRNCERQVRQTPNRDWGKAEAASGVDNSRSGSVRVGNWLTPEQAKSWLLAPDENTRKGKRDGALLGLLVGCALRRSELVSRVVDKIQMRDDRWVIPDLVGKRKKLRLVPVPGWVKARLDLWTVAAKITEGKIFRAVVVFRFGRSCCITRTWLASSTWHPTI